MPTPVQHIIVLMLENRSFDHLFAYSGIPGLLGVDTSLTNPDAAGKPIAMSDGMPDRCTTDPGHEFENVDWQIYGVAPETAPRPERMDGFANKGCPEAMACAKSSLVAVLVQLGRQFLVCDNWFSSMPGPTWPNRFFVHAGSSGGLANSPSNLSSLSSILWSKVGFSFERGTLYQALENAGHTWRVYHGDHFPQVCAIDSMPSVFVASPDRFRKVDDFAADAGIGDIADYTFIEPNYSILTSFRSGDSQHPAGTLSAGEQLISTVANAVMSSPQWDSSLLIIVYDEHGGFYDQMPPPSGAAPPGDTSLNADKASNPPDPPFSFDRYGVRVPAVIVSPCVKAGVSHAIYDHATVIRTVFDTFGLPGQLTERDGKATSLAPLIQDAPLVAAPAAIPVANAAAADPLTPGSPPRYVHSVDGFARIAAQIHHALLTHQANPAMSPRELHASISARDPDLSYLPELPKTESPDEARAYIEHVAGLMAVHRLQQRAGTAT